jgi:hypothetical protein
MQRQQNNTNTTWPTDTGAAAQEHGAPVPQTGPPVLAVRAEHQPQPQQIQYFLIKQAHTLSQ